MEVFGLDGESYVVFSALFASLNLERGGGAEGGIESQVVRLAVRGAGLNIAAALAVGAGAAPLAALIAGELVERGVEGARGELVGGLYFFAALPPVSVARFRGLLGGGLGLPEVGRFFSGLVRYALFFFTCDFSSEGVGWLSAPPNSLRICSIRSSRS